MKAVGVGRVGARVAEILTDALTTQIGIGSR